MLPYRVLNAADFGVPQDRKRLFVIGARRGLPTSSYPTPHEERATVWEAIGDLPDADEFDELNANDAVKVQWESKAVYARRLRGLDADPTNFGYPRTTDRNLLTSSLRTEHTALSKSRFLATEHGKTEAVSHFRKLPPDGLCNTLRAGTDSARGAFTSPRPIHPFVPRVITVREAARLHSYPDWFRFHATKWHGFRQIGNSVPPLLARAVAGEIINALKMKPHHPSRLLTLGDTELLNFDMGGAAHHFRVPRTTIAQRTRKKNENQQDLWEEAHA
jgi:DNA (cytosine-5)-methyltransferase 1